MKKLALAVLFASAASVVSAAGPSEPIIEPEPVVVVEDTAPASSAQGIVVPLLALALIAAAASD